MQGAIMSSGINRRHFIRLLTGASMIATTPIVGCDPSKAASSSLKDVIPSPNAKNLAAAQPLVASLRALLLNQARMIVDEANRGVTVDYAPLPKWDRVKEKNYTAADLKRFMESKEDMLTAMQFSFAHHFNPSPFVSAFNNELSRQARRGTNFRDALYQAGVAGAAANIPDLQKRGWSPTNAMHVTQDMLITMATDVLGHRSSEYLKDTEPLERALNRIIEDTMLDYKGLTQKEYFR
jgi:hypothetical protein